jgi:ElaB/YqjD/DUF883 family membrane-anchored ribosome-binding protein
MTVSIPQQLDSIGPDTTAESLRETVASLAEIVADQQETITELQQETSELQDQLADVADQQAEQARQTAEDRQRVTSLEDQFQDRQDQETGQETGQQTSDPQGDDGQEQTTGGQTAPQTPLEQTVTLPQEMIDQETANVRRAIFVARDVADYTRSVPAGRVITASRLRTVLKAGTDCRGHSQTVDRVIGILDDMGDDTIRVVERRGQRRVVFDQAAADRLGKLGTAPDAAADHGVVIEGPR